MTDRQEEIVERAVLDALVRGESEGDLLLKLEGRFDSASARRIMKNALERYSALKQNGKLIDYEYNMVFDRPRSRVTKRDLWGAVCLVGGIAASVYGYLHAFPGQTYAAYVGLILFGVYLLSTDD